MNKQFGTITGIAGVVALLLLLTCSKLGNSPKEAMFITNL